MKTFVSIALAASIFLLSNCQKPTETDIPVNHINCDGLITDTLGTNDNGRIFMQNAFTPNNDRLNDLSRVVVKNVSSLEFTIYDENNKIVFTTNQLIQTQDGYGYSSHWAPTTNASTFETYYYKIQATTKSNHRIGACGKLYKLACFPSSVPRTSVHFEDQLMIDGIYSSTTLEKLSNCP